MNNDQVGKVSYVVEIDTAALKSGTKTAEEAIRGSMKDVESSFDGASSSADKFDHRINNITKGLKPFATASAVASGAVVAGFTAAAKASFDQVRAVENASFGLKAYEKDARAVAKVQAQLIEFARSDQGVLFQREELFQAASTLKGFGEATSELNSRVQILAKGVAAGGASFAELSEFVGRAANAGELSAVAYDQLARRMIILDPALRGAKVSADELYEAIDRAIDDSIFEGRAQTIEGRVIRLKTAWRDLGASILGVNTQTSQFIEGGLGDMIVKSLEWLRGFIAENKTMIVGVGAAVTVFGSLVGTAYVATRAIAAIRASMAALGVTGAVTQARMLGLIGVISAIAGIVAGAAIQTQLDETTDGLDDMNVALDDTVNYSGQAADSVDSLSKRLDSLRDQSRKVERDYIENLARIVQRHQESVRTLTKQIEDENDSYNAAVAKRLAAFEEQQGKEESEHLKKTREIQTQIDFLRKYDNESNRQKLSELQFALAREKSEYEKRNAERKAVYDADAEAEKTSYEQRLKENQKKLDEELAILDKHKDSVKKVRGVVLLDEIESLKRSRQEQLKSLQQQRQDAIRENKRSADQAGAAFRDGFQEYLDDIKKNAAKAGKQSGKSFWENLIGESNVQLVRQGASNVAKYGPWALFGGGSLWTWESVERRASMKASNPGGGGWATGGYTGRGGTYEPAGIVHRGEYVIPKTHVNQSTGLPDFDKLLGNINQPQPPNVTINVSGVLADSETAKRRFAEMIADKLSESQRARGIA